MIEFITKAGTIGNKIGGKISQIEIVILKIYNSNIVIIVVIKDQYNICKSFHMTELDYYIIICEFFHLTTTKQIFHLTNKVYFKIVNQA